MSHTVGIVGHIDRADRVRALASHVRPEIISIDNGDLSCEGNHRHVWSTLATDYLGSRWTVVLEDDAVPVDNFDVQLEHALRAAPASVVSLYLGRTRPPDAQGVIRQSVRVANLVDAHWLVSDRLLHAVGVAIRTPLVSSMLDYIAQPPAVFDPIDIAISRWAQANRIPVAYTWPSLVDHADGPTVIEEHPDSASRDRLIPLPDGRMRLARRVAWRVGARDRWTHNGIRMRLSVQTRAAESTGQEG
jgi:hypothetical protein